MSLTKSIPTEFTTIATRRHNSGLWIEKFSAPMTCAEARTLVDEGVLTMVQKRYETYSELWVRMKRK